MKKLDNYRNCLNVLQGSDRTLVSTNEIYRTGVIGQFNLTFELAWKLLQQVLRMHSVVEADTGSPREIIKLGFKVGFLNDEDAWSSMLKDRNSSVHIYDEDEITSVIDRIFDMYMPAFENFYALIKTKIDELE